MIGILFQLASYVINLFKWAVILAAIFSLLTAFGVLDTRNRIVWTIGDFLYRVTEPVLRPIRNMLPNLGGIDLSPWIVVVLHSNRHSAAAGQTHARSPMERGNRCLSTMFWRPLARRRCRRGEGAAEVAPARRAGPCPISRWRAAAHRRHRGRGGRPCQPRRLRRAGRRARHLAPSAVRLALGATSREKTLHVAGDPAALGAKLAAL